MESITITPNPIMRHNVLAAAGLPDTAPSAPKVGDRVELTDLEDGVRVSFLGTVHTVRPNGLWVRMDNGEVWSTVGGGPVLRSIL